MKKLTLYRFFTLTSNFRKTFATDGEMFDYANGLTDNAVLPTIQKFKGGDWLDWSISGECWVYDGTRQNINEKGEFLAI